MPEVILYIASTIDGFIADEDGSVAFLDPYNTEDYGFTEFFAGIDAVIMGRRTYDHGKNLGAVYEGKKVIVLTRSPDFQEPGVIARSAHPQQIIAEDCRGFSKIWIAGGGEIVTEFLNAGLIDLIQLFVVPQLLGRGIRLFRDGLIKASFSLRKTQSYKSGIVLLEYART